MRFGGRWSHSLTLVFGAGSSLGSSGVNIGSGARGSPHLVTWFAGLQLIGRAAGLVGSGSRETRGVSRK